MIPLPANLDLGEAPPLFQATTRAHIVTAAATVAAVAEIDPVTVATALPTIHTKTLLLPSYQRRH